MSSGVYFGNFKKPSKNTPCQYQGLVQSISKKMKGV